MMIVSPSISEYNLKILTVSVDLWYCVEITRFE